MVILGIDPGLNATGYGLLDVASDRMRMITAGEIRPPRSAPLMNRLARLRDELSQIILRHHPDTMVLETVFMHHRYPSTAARLGHARGVTCLVAQEHGMTLAEHAPARVKKALTGNGNASKAQVARMVGQWLGCELPALSTDATDALALAIAHVHMSAGVARG